jgi:hypothetical protein
MCRNPRNVNVSGFPSPRAFRFRAACGPNSISRVFSGCSSRLNFASLAVGVDLEQDRDAMPGSAGDLSGRHPGVQLQGDSRVPQVVGAEAKR